MVDDPDPLTAAGTDAPVVLRLADTNQPKTADADRTQAVNGIALDLSGLPAGTRFSTDGGASIIAAGGSGLHTLLTTAEGDIKLFGSSAVTLFENDAVGGFDDLYAGTVHPCHRADCNKQRS